MKIVWDLFSNNKNNIEKKKTKFKCNELIGPPISLKCNVNVQRKKN